MSSGPHFINLMKLVSMFHWHCVCLACQLSLSNSAYLSEKAFPNPQAIISLELPDSNQINRSKDWLPGQSTVAQLELRVSIINLPQWNYIYSHQLEAGHGSSYNLGSILHCTRAGSSTSSSETLHGLILCRKSQVWYLKDTNFCYCTQASSLKLNFCILVQHCSEVYSPILPL